jgi:hypothetical protein
MCMLRKFLATYASVPTTLPAAKVLVESV